MESGRFAQQVGALIDLFFFETPFGRLRRLLPRPAVILGEILPQSDTCSQTNQTIRTGRVFAMGMIDFD
jgi:hypothetical protein